MFNYLDDKENNNNPIQQPAQKGKVPFVFNLVAPDTYIVGAKTPPQQKNKLDPGVYRLEFHPEAGYYLVAQSKNFDMPGVVYGDITSKVDKYFNTYKQRDKTTGILLVGEKGSGKTLTAKALANKCIESGMLVILMSSQAKDGAFSQFLNNCPQDVVVFIDEFEKVYDYDEDNQDGLLPVLDGTLDKKLLFIMTANHSDNINSCLINRPGRLYYVTKYQTLPFAVANDYAQQNVINKEHIPELLMLISFERSFNFDMFAALVEEMNRYNYSAMEALVDLNIDKGDAPSVDITCQIKNKEGQLHYQGTSYNTTLNGENFYIGIHNLDVMKTYNMSPDDIYRASATIKSIEKDNPELANILDKLTVSYLIRSSDFVSVEPSTGKLVFNVSSECGNDDVDKLLNVHGSDLIVTLEFNTKQKHKFNYLNKKLDDPIQEDNDRLYEDEDF